MKIVLVLVCMIVSTCSWSQEKQQITEAEKHALVDSLTKRLVRYYVFADKAKEIGQHLNKRLKTNAYKNISSYQAFVDTVGKDIERVHLDQHLWVAYDPKLVEFLKEDRSRPEPTPARQEEEKAWYRKNNYGLTTVERLPGNIGYMAIADFSNVTEESRNTVASAFRFIAYTDAVIIDLRNCNGGHPLMVQEILSYFFDKPVHYSTVHDMHENKTVEYRILDTVKGPKLAGKKLYVLTGGPTFSAGEAFAYYVKHTKRGVIVGENTAGASHGAQRYVVNDVVAMNIPFVREINPVTKTDWEGAGVAPDVTVKGVHALVKAQELIIREVMPTVTDPGQKEELEWSLVGVQAELAPVMITEQQKQDYSGAYAGRRIFMEDGHLVYQRGTGKKFRLQPLSENTFALEGIDFFRVRFNRDANGKVKELIGWHKQGFSEKFPRQN